MAMGSICKSPVLGRGLVYCAAVTNGLAAIGIVVAFSQSASAEQSFCDKNSGKFTIKLSSCSVDTNGNSAAAPINGGGRGAQPGGNPGGGNPGGGGTAAGGPTPG